MKLEKKSPTVFNVTLHAYELATLISVARWALEGAEGELDNSLEKKLSQLLSNFDKEREEVMEEAI